MSLLPKITIVTPSYNSVKYIERTILSVIEQNYPNLEYIVIDGGSTDGTIDIIKKYEHKLACWISEPDKGMYFAIQKGFEKSTGEIMGWINSDDKHHPRSLFMLAGIFKNQHINWVQGIPSVFDKNDAIVYANSRPEVDKLFFYQTRHLSTGKYIQQESTFWRRNLWEKAGSYISTQFKWAGDFELWIRFFKYADLYNVPALLAGFRISDNQISSIHYKEYQTETIAILAQNPLPENEQKCLKKRNLSEKMNRSALFRKMRLEIKIKELGVINGSLRYDHLNETFIPR